MKNCQTTEMALEVEVTCCHSFIPSRIYHNTYTRLHQSDQYSFFSFDMFVRGQTDTRIQRVQKK